MVSKNELGKEDILESPSKEEAQKRRFLNQHQLDKNILKEAMLVMQESAAANILNNSPKEISIERNEGERILKAHIVKKLAEGTQVGSLKTKLDAIEAAEAAKKTGMHSESKKATPGRLNIQGDNWMNRNKNTGQTV